MCCLMTPCFRKDDYYYRFSSRYVICRRIIKNNENLMFFLNRRVENGAKIYAEAFFIALLHIIP